MKVYKYGLVVCAVALSFFSNAQSHDPEEEHSFKHFRISGAIGQTYIPEATSGNAAFVVVPTLGLDLQYWFKPRWGIGLKNDIELANYLVDDKDGNSAVIRNNPVIIALPALFSPWESNFTFILGPGLEIESHENFFIFRAGVGSEFEIGNHWDFAPEIIYDLKNGHINTISFAIGVGKRF